MKRIAMLIGLKPEMAAEYRALHAAAWPEVLATLKRANIANYSIFLKDDLLVGYLEYHGEDYEADMALVAADPVTRRWWALTDPCQNPLPSRGTGEHWAQMTEIFHLD